jgi:hypothetical protein
MIQLSFPVRLTGATRHRIGWFRRPILQVLTVTKCVRNFDHIPHDGDPPVDGYSWRDASADDLIELGKMDTAVNRTPVSPSSLFSEKVQGFK